MNEEKPKKKAWIVPTLTKVNLKENTLGSGGSCPDGGSGGNMTQVGGGNEPGCGPGGGGGGGGNP